VIEWGDMTQESNSEESLKSMQEIVEVLRYLVLRDGGLRLGTEGLRKAQETVSALVEKYKVPPLRPP
jgi:hypothetical protein